MNSGVPLNGYMADLQIWDKALSYEEMIDITTCKSFPKGNLMAWNAEDWGPVFPSWTDWSYEDVDSNDFCPKNFRYLYFPGTNAATFDDIEQFCQKFGGNVVNTTTKEQVQDAFDFFKNLWYDANWPQDVGQSGMFLTVWNDNAEEGNWTHIDTSQPPPEIVWHLSEPNGETGENCLQYTLVVTNKGTENEKVSSLVGRDYSCKGKRGVLCEDTRKFSGIIFGLCKATHFDTTYLLNSKPSGIDEGNQIRRFFSGNTGCANCLG